MTIKEVYAGMDKETRYRMMLALSRDGVSFFTVHAWCSGSRRPKLLYQKRLREEVRKLTGRDIRIEELFPEAVEKLS